MNVTRCALIALSLWTFPLPAADWRVASISNEGGITFVDAASVKRSGDQVAFRVDHRWAVPRKDGSVALLEQVDSDCVSRNWTSKSGSKKVGEISMTIKTIAAPRTVYDAVLTAACTGEFRSGAVANRDRYAAAFFTATGSTAERLDAGARTQPGYVPPPQPVAVQDPNKFESAAAGFSLQKPDGWRFVPLEEAKKNRAELRVGDEELQKLVDERDAFLAENAVTQLVTIERSNEIFGGFKPTLLVSVRPLEPDLKDLSPRNVVEEVLLQLQKGFSDVVVESPVRELKLAGRTAADYVATYTARTKDGRVIPTRTRLAVVIADKLIFFVAMASARRDDQARQEFEKILSSITIGK